MTENSLFFGIGIGGVTVGTIAAVAYIYANKQKEKNDINAAGINTNSITSGNDENLSFQEKRARRIKAEKQEQERRKQIEQENYRKSLKQEQMESESIPELTRLFEEREKLKGQLEEINKKIATMSTPSQEKNNLTRERDQILKQNKELERKIQKYNSDLIQIAKNRMSFKQDDIARQSKPAFSSDSDIDESDEPDEDKDIDIDIDEDDDTLFGTKKDNPNNDLIMRSENESRDSFSSITGGSKKIILGYTPQKLTKNHKAKKHRTNKKRYKSKTKRNNK